MSAERYAYLGKRIYIEGWGLAQIVAFNGVSYIFALLRDFRLSYKRKNTFAVFTISEDKIDTALRLPELIQLKT